MLIGIFAAVSLIAGSGLCLLTDAFSDLNWLWILPLSALGAFILQLALWFLMVVIMGAVADQDKKQEEDNKFYRWVLQKTLESLLPMMGIRFHTEGFDRKLPEGRFLLVSNHLHDIDPAMLLYNFPKSQLGFIGKREVKGMFLAGPFLKMTMGQFVNRENDREALKTILECIRIIKEDKASIAVFPEGYIMPDRLFRPLKPGVFKIAQRARVPIVVCSLKGTNKALGTVAKLRGADVHVHLVDIIPVEELKNVTTVDIAHRVYTMIAQDLGPDMVYPLETAESTENT